MTVYKDNPAGRLHQLLAAFRDASDQREFARALRVSFNDKNELWRSFTQVFALPDDIRVEISRIDEDNYDSDLALRWQNHLVSVMGETLFWGEKKPDSSAFSEFQASLEYCSYVLNKYQPGRIPSEADLEHLKELISDLLTELQDDSPVDADLRDFLRLHAREMEHALNDLAVRGVVPLEEAFDRTLGALNRRVDLTVRSDENPNVWKKFGNLLVAVAAVLQISTSAFILPGQVRQAIEGPQPTQVEVVQQQHEAATDPTVKSRLDDGSRRSVNKDARDKTSPTT